MQTYIESLTNAIAADLLPLSCGEARTYRGNATLRSADEVVLTATRILQASGMRLEPANIPYAAPSEGKGCCAAHPVQGGFLLVTARSALPHEESTVSRVVVQLVQELPLPEKWLARFASGAPMERPLHYSEVFEMAREDLHANMGIYDQSTRIWWPLAAQMALLTLRSDLRPARDPGPGYWNRRADYARGSGYHMASTLLPLTQDSSMAVRVRLENQWQAILVKKEEN